MARKESIEERVIKILSLKKPWRRKLEDFGITDKLTLEYLLESLPRKHILPEIKTTLLNDLYYRNTKNVSDNVVEDMREMIINRDIVRRSSRIEQVPAIPEPQLRVAARGYIGLFRKKELTDEIIKASSKSDLKLLLYIEELNEKTGDNFIIQILRASKYIDSAARDCSEYWNELISFNETSIELDKEIKSCARIFRKKDFSDAAIKSIKQASGFFDSVTFSYKFLERNQSYAREVENRRSGSDDYKKNIDEWLNKTLKQELDSEAAGIQVNMPQELDQASKHVNNRLVELKGIAERYDTAGFSNDELFEKIHSYENFMQQVEDGKKLHADLSKTLTSVKKNLKRVRKLKISPRNADKTYSELVNLESSQRSTKNRLDRKDYGFDLEILKKVYDSEYAALQQELKSKIVMAEEKKAYSRPTGWRKLFRNPAFMATAFGLAVIPMCSIFHKAEYKATHNKTPNVTSVEGGIKKSSKLERKVADAGKMLASHLRPENESENSPSYDMEKENPSKLAPASMNKSAKSRQGYEPRALNTIPNDREAQDRQPDVAAYHASVKKENSFLHSLNREEDKKPETDPLLIKKQVQQKMKYYQSRYETIQGSVSGSPGLKQYDIAQERLARLESEMKRFMNTDLYRRYKRLEK